MLGGKVQGVKDDMAGICSIYDLHKIQEDYLNVKDNEQFLSSNDLKNLNKVGRCLDKYNKSMKDINFSTDLHNALYIYDLSDEFKSGKKFNPTEKLKDIEGYEVSFQSAMDIYQQYVGRDFPNFNSISSVITDLKKSVQKCVDEFGDSNNCYYKKYVVPQCPFNESDIDSIISFFNLNVAKKSFSD